MVESYAAALRGFNFDKARLGQVEITSFNRELSALTFLESACKRMLELVAKGVKLPNPNNSSVGYVMGITDEIPNGDVPVYYDKELPDIDIDFDSERRHEVKSYLERTYGISRVASLATFGTFKGRLC